jgi:phosphoserine phosphatase RsbU/P
LRGFSAMDSQESRTRPLWLIGLEGKARRVRLPINTPLLVGRGASNHIVLDDPRISRQHARLTPERDGTFIYDLASGNGTLVNGVAVTKHKLQPNDVVRFGRYAFRVELGPENERLDPSHLESPTLIATESVARMLVARESSAAERPLVDLTQLEDAYQKLGTLYSFMQGISTTIDRGELLRLIGTKVREVYPYARTLAIFLRERNGTFHLAHFSGAGITSDQPSLPPDVLEALLASARPVLSADIAESTRTPGGGNMFAPMIDRGEVLGVIHVAADENRQLFTAADLELLNGMAAASALMLQNTRMYEESLQRDRLKYDLELAAKIQKSFLPREVVSVEGLELFAEYRAAYTVGGDFYDVFWVAEDRLAVFIGDISGKGVAAALLMARISSELRVAALAHVEPTAVLSAMNEAILASGQPELFFTAIYLTFDVKTGEIVLANAGHPSPYRCDSSGGVAPIVDGASSAIGILDDPGFESTTFTLAHGDSLVLYTDGVIEASDARGDLYGSQRLEACLNATRSTRPNEIAERILRSVEDYATDAAAADDLTLFICHRTVGKSASLQPRRRSGTLATPVIPRN